MKVEGWLFVGCAAFFAIMDVIYWQFSKDVGSATRETRQAMGDLCKANLDAWFAGKPLPAPIPELA